MQNILASIGVIVERSEAGGVFNDYVKKRLILNHQGEVVSEMEGNVRTLSEDGKEAYDNGSIQQPRRGNGSGLF